MESQGLSPPPSAAGSASGVATVAPTGALRGRVASIQVIASHTPEIAVLPGTAVVLGLQWRGRVRAPEGMLAAAGVTGLQEGVRRYAYSDDASTVLARFTPLGAACLGVPVSALSGRSVPLDALLPPARVRRALEELGEARDDRARIAAVEALLLELPAAGDPLVKRALMLQEAHRRWDGPLVRRLTAELAISERQLERRFERAVGLTPKRYAALRRFERAAALLRGGEALGALAIEAGYYDQAHMNRDFRRFGGASPGELRRRG